MHRHYTYLALGDSYTIGEGLPLQQSFPYQLVQLLRKSSHDFAAPEIIAKTGWTSEELQSAINDYAFSSRYDLVTLLIGVNNQYRKQEILIYQQQAEALLMRCIELAGGKKDHVFVLSIPDYSSTPFARSMDRELIHKEIDGYNSLVRALSIQYKVQFVDNHEPIGEGESKAPGLAADGLHPAAAEYAKWARRLAEATEKLLKK